MVKEFEKKRNKKAQLTIFIILAILIVIVLVLLFVNKDKFNILLGTESSYNQIEKCIKESASDGVGTIENQGGAINPQNYFLYEGNKVDYVCYTSEYYEKCVMQKPLLKQSIEKEIKDYLKERVNGCLGTIKDSVEKKGYSMTFNEPNISVEILPSDVIVKLSNLDLAIVKEQTETYKNIKVNVDSKLYDFVMTASSIANWEATYGESESLNYMLFYPELKVEKKIRSDGTKIYILTNRDTLEKFMFAFRSIAYPPGVTGN